MQTVLRFIPGFVAAVVAFGVTKLFAWTELGFEFGTFLVLYVVLAISVERALKRYGGPRN